MKEKFCFSGDYMTDQFEKFGVWGQNSEHFFEIPMK